MKMTRNKPIISAVLFLMLFTFLMLTGCATYRDMPPGTVKDIPGQETKDKNSQNVHSPIVEQQIVTVSPLSEPPPPPDYIVGPYDVLSINVSKPDFSGMGSASGSSSLTESNLGTGTQATGYRVDGKGNIQLPFVGTLHVSGMTQQDIQNQLMKIYPKYFKDPWVAVDVKEYKSQPLYILGQFNNTGVIYMDRPFNVLQGLAMGKGYDASANPRAARIIRDKKVLPVDIYELLMNADQSQNIWLKPGDTIYMPDNKNRVVFVFGAAKGGGPVSIPPAGLNLLQAIATVGLQEIGYHARRVFLIRSFSPTRGQLMLIDVDKIIQGDAMPMALTEGDIIYIPKSALTTWNEALGEMLPTLSAFSAILSPFVQIKYLSQ
ncbi:MAG: sugar transporter [Deltaproteobacteria bacterium HGW-Deltaproteobacteria-2]|nr:MAG: sugar transporter [Deltaproteobacteria bacterium HGW-Deltaproteobacteria-2]